MARARKAGAAGAAFDRKLSVLLVGTHPAGQGGIASVGRGYAEHAGSRDVAVRLVVTHGSGSMAKKLALAAGGTLRCAAVLVRRRADVVHLLVSSGGSFWRKLIVAALACLSRVPLIVHIHSGKFTAYAAGGSPLKRSCARWFLCRADLVLVLSGQMRGEVRSVEPSATTHILPNAVPLPEGCVKYGAEPRTIVAIGKLAPQKGTPELISAFSALDAPDARLVLAGHGDRRGAEAHAAGLGVEDRVECIGWIDHPRRDELLAASTLFALPSHSEGMPMALLEAMAHGVPSVATRVGAIPEVITDGVNGALVPVGDVARLTHRVQELMDSVALRERLGRTARETIQERFAIDSVAEELRQLWRSVADPGS